MKTEAGTYHHILSSEYMVVALYSHAKGSSKNFSLLFLLCSIFNDSCDSLIHLFSFFALNLNKLSRIFLITSNSESPVNILLASAKPRSFLSLN